MKIKIMEIAFADFNYITEFFEAQTFENDVRRTVSSIISIKGEN